MKLINLTILRKKRLKIMLAVLFPEYEYIRIKSNGLVDFKEKWYSLRIDQKNINITDICIYHLPRKLDELAGKKGFGRGYINLFMSMINDILRYRVHLGYTDVTDYLWEEFERITKRQQLIPTEKPFKQLNVYNTGIFSLSNMIHPVSRLNLIQVKNIIKLMHQRVKPRYIIKQKINNYIKIFRYRLALT